MLQQIDNIIYNVVYHNMLSTDLFNEFSNIINELNDDNNTDADIKNKAIKLNFKKMWNNAIKYLLRTK